MIMSTDTKTFNSSKTMLKIVIWVILCSAILGFAYLNAPIDFDRECVIYDEQDVETTTNAQINAGDCKEPVLDGIFNNLLEHAPWMFWIEMILAGGAFIILTWYVYDMTRYMFAK